VRTLGRLAAAAFGAAVGYLFGWAYGMQGHLYPQPVNYPSLAEQLPLPHHVPKYADGLSFRFAMAQDVLHERFPKHGPAHYRERDRLTRLALAALPEDDPARLPLLDDLGVGLDRLGRSDEAVATLRRKLESQRARGLAGRDLYTSYANLGTFLIHGSFARAVGGDTAARAQFREGVELIRKSVEVNPEAHFGRERWQAEIAEFLLAAMDDPRRLKATDCLGDKLDLGIEPMLDREAHWWYSSYGRPMDSSFSRGQVVEDVPAFFRSDIEPDDPSHWAELAPIREHITKVGAEDAPEGAHRQPAPFDGPMLGIIGMWRQGGGANPHFALAVGEVMLRVGQRYIAWSAFERASRLAGRFWPDPELQQFLRDHCRRRQAEIETTLTYRPEAKPRNQPWQQVSPPPTPAEVAGLRASFDAELAYGEGYQRDYQAFEAAKIAEGASVDDEHLFDEFLAARPPIASPVGPEESFVWVRPSRMYEFGYRRGRAWGVVGAGLGAMTIALALQLSRMLGRYR